MGCTIEIVPGVTVHQFEERDAPALLRLIERNREFFRDRLPLSHEVFTEEDALARIRTSIDGFARGGAFWAGIWRGNRQLIGGIGLSGRDPQNRSAQLGFWLTREATGQGLMVRAVQAVLSYVFDTLGIRRLEIRCGTENAAAKVIARRIGFKLEGTLRQAEQCGEAFRDVLVFGMLDSEWRARNDLRPAEDAETGEAGGLPSPQEHERPVEDEYLAAVNQIMQDEGFGPWRSVDGAERSGFQAEVLKEVGPGHVLWQVPLLAIATRVDARDVLVAFQDGSQRVAVVHLTWGGERGSPRVPKTTLFQTFERWVMQVMQQEYFLPRST